MSELHQLMKKWVENYGKTPEEFMPFMESMAERVPAKEKGNFFLYSGAGLQNSSCPELALAVLDKAFEYFRKHEDKLGESKCYGSMGLAHEDLGNHKKAIEYYKRSLEIDTKIGNKRGELTNYTNLGLVYDKLKNYKIAIVCYKKGLKIGKEVGDRAEQSKCYINLGVAHSRLKDFWKAIEYYEKALAMDIEIGNKEGELKNYTNLRISYENLEDFRKAVDYAGKELEIDLELGDEWKIAVDYGSLGLNYIKLGEFEKATEYIEKALAIDIKIGDKEGMAADHGNLSLVYSGMGQFRKSIVYQEKSIEIYKEIDNKPELLRCYSDVGFDYIKLGEFRKAIEYLNKALEINKEIGDREAEASCYSNLVMAYSGMGAYEKSVKYIEKALKISEEISNKSGQVTCYINLGSEYGRRGNYKKSIECSKKALDICRETSIKPKEAHCYLNIGISYVGLGEFKKAFEYHRKALVIYKEIGDKEGAAYSYENLAITYTNIAKFKEALDNHKEALEICKEIGTLTLEKKINQNLAALYYFYDLPVFAYDYYKIAIELSEKLRERIFEEENKISFSESNSDAYNHMISLCFRLEKNNESFDYLEKNKSRTLLDLLSTTNIQPHVETTLELKSLLSQEEFCLTKLRSFQTQDLTQKKTNREPGELDEIVEELDNVYNKIETFDPNYVFIRRGKPLSAENIINLISTQNRNLVLLEYFLTKDELYIFIFPSRDKQLYIEKISISQDKINRYISEDYWRSVVKYRWFKDIGESWLGLSNYLIDPISKYLAKGDLIYFIPHGLLHYLPMHALELNGEPLIKHHPVTYSPSASLIRFCQNKGSGELKSCVSFGVAIGKEEEAEFEEKIKNMNKEDKKEIEEKIKKVKEIFEGESKNVGGFFNGKTYLGYDATKKQAIKTCIDEDILHFSCHGYFDDNDPLSSGVKLYDGVLTAREIFDMRLNTELVTLSACQTGINKRRPGDELIGLTRAFLYAGAPSIIVSLWSVDAPSTQELMIEFYKSLKNGFDKATALQQSQKKIMGKEKYSHPYYWAPFMLVGDWE